MTPILQVEGCRSEAAWAHPLPSAARDWLPGRPRAAGLPGRASLWLRRQMGRGTPSVFSFWERLPSKGGRCSWQREVLGKLKFGGAD